MRTKTVVAKYVLYSRFTIPKDVTEYEIHWDRLTYTDADGNDVELEPTEDCQDDHEVYHRPTESYIEGDTQGKTEMKEWVEHALSSELTRMPIWTVSAFGALRDGDRLKKDDVRIDLITHLAKKHIDAVPLALYNEDFATDWKTAEFIPVVKSAVKKCKEILGRVDAPETSDAPPPSA